MVTGVPSVFVVGATQVSVAVLLEVGAVTVTDALLDVVPPAPVQLNV